MRATAEISPKPPVLCLADIASEPLRGLLARFRLTLECVAEGEEIAASYWGAPEAGIAGQTVYVRDDTPIHSVLHEVAHVVCMSAARRAALYRDAGGDDDEESAVCYLQVVLADCLRDVGGVRIMRDMDTWGYNFRLGSTARWLAADAGDARQWLADRGLIARDGSCCFRLCSR